MRVVYKRCCGLDVHKKSITACVVISEGSKAPRTEMRTFGTMTDDLVALSQWLSAKGVTNVAMESTGVYWKPVYNLLEGSFELLLANAQQVKNVPGRKTDAKDAEWIADLYRHGLLAPSFVPDREQRELRDLTRYRCSLVRERASEINRLQKTLEGANIKLGSVASDVFGASGQAMLEAMVAGESDPKVLANLAKGKLRDKLPELEQALKGRMSPHQRFMLASQLQHIRELERLIEEVSAEIERRTLPFAAQIQRLDEIPGIALTTAQVLVAEIGVDMSRFPTAHHLASWAGLCPGNNESGGKRHSGKTRKGSPWLRGALVEAAHGAARTKGSYLSSLYRRIAKRRGAKKALVAVAHAILVIVYHLLERDDTYRDLGVGYYDKRDRQTKEKYLIRQLEALGNTVTIEPIAQAA